MKGLIVNENSQLMVDEFEVPVINECQALVKTLACGVCNGTDLKLIHKTFKNMNRYPMILGHEAVGQVVSVGSKVTKYKVGDVVLLPFLYEEQKGYSLGWGGYAEYTVIGDSEAYIANGMGPGTKEFSETFFAQSIIKPKDKVDAVGAAMIITFREVLSAIKRFGFEANKSIVIFGAGPVGLCFTKFCKLLGLSTVITVDIMDEKIEQAKSMGADYIFNSLNCNVNEEIRKICPDGASYVVDAVGLNTLINQGLGIVADHGKVCVYGISAKLGMEIDWSNAPYNWELCFVQMPSKKEESDAHTQIMAWINAGVLNPMDFISDVVEFDHILDAFVLVEQRKPGTKKIVIKY